MMAGLSALIGPLLGAVGELIKAAIDDSNAGQEELARTKLKYFTALAKASRDNDRAKAEAILNARFDPAVSPREEEDIYAEFE